MKNATYEKRTPISFQFEQKPHVLIVQASYYDEIADLLREGALAVLKNAGVSHEVVDVPGVFEIPAAIVYAVKSLDFDAMRRRFDGYVALGCILKNETSNNEIIAGESARAMQDIATRFALAIGNGILSCNTREQAFEHAHPDKFDLGGATTEACLRMIELKHLFRLSPKRRWVAR